MTLTTLAACTLFFLGQAAHATEVRPLKVDSSGFPKVRVYVQAPEGGWQGGSATVDFNLAPDDSRDAALSWIAENPSVELPTLKPIKTSAGGVQVLTFDQQDDPSEGRLVVFLIDGSGSMKEPLKKEVPVLTAAIYDALRPSDRVVITGFATESVEILAPTTKRSGALIGDELRQIPQLTERLKKAKAGNSTKIYDALARAIQGRIRDTELPMLLGRRYFFLFSDGKDEKSRIQTSDLANEFTRLQDKAPAVFTVGVGRGSKERFTDMYRAAQLAGNVNRFVEKPTPEALRSHFEKASKGLEDQLLIEFEVPAFFHTRDNHKAIIELRPKGGSPISTHLELTFNKMSDGQVSKGKQYRQEIATVTTAWNDKEQTAKLIKMVGGGVLGIVLLGLIVWRGNEAKKRREWQQDEQLQTRMDEQASQARTIAQEIMQNQSDAAREAASANRKPLGMLMGMDGPLKGQRYGFFEPRSLIGRDPDKCQVIFPSEGGDPAISRVHAEFAMAAGGWQVRAMSGSGLEVGNTRLQKNDAYPVKFGDSVLIGNTRFVFQAP